MFFVDYLGKKLEVYVDKNFGKLVKIIRLKSRHGLIRARMAGMKAATSEVAVFLDSHCECNHGW